MNEFYLTFIIKILFKIQIYMKTIILAKHMRSGITKVVQMVPSAPGGASKEGDVHWRT